MGCHKSKNSLNCNSFARGLFLCTFCDAVGYSEFSQITEEVPKINTAAVALPNIYGMRVFARYQQDLEKDTVDGFERLYIYKVNSLDIASETMSCC